MKNEYYGALWGVAFVSAVFTLVVAALLIVSAVQRNYVALPDSPVLERLHDRLQENPDDAELVAEVRTLDLTARKAFFGSVAFTRVGAWLLLGGLVVLLVSAKAATSLGRGLPDPGKFEVSDDAGGSRAVVRCGIGIGGAVAFALAVALGLTTGLIKRSAPPSPSAEVVDVDVAPPYDGPSQEEISVNWPSLRGPGGLGIASGDDFPRRWNVRTGRNIRWKVAAPQGGFNSPVVWSNRLFLSAADFKKLTVFCFDTSSGKQLWQRDVAGASGPHAKRPTVGEDTGYAAPTMATDGSRAFAIFATGDVICTDFFGKVLWSRNLGMPENPYGHASSLIYHSGLLLIQYDHQNAARVVALHASTGEIAWSKKREVDASWASPIVANNNGRMELVLNANPFVVSYDPLTGTEHWRVECMSGEVAPSPAYADGRVFVTTAYAVLAAIKPSVPAKVIWEVHDDLPDVASPLATDGRLYVASSDGIVTCFRSSDGTVLWTKEFNDGFYSSPILVGGNVYLMDEKGVMHVFVDAPEPRMVAFSRLEEKSWCTPAFVKGRVYIRGERHLFCMEEYRKR